MDTGGQRGSVRISLAGRIAIDTDHGRVEQTGMGGRQALVVFAYLALERRRAVAREELAEALWPESLPQSWESAIRVVVSKVRSVLAEVGLPPAESLTSEFGCYQLNLPADSVVDIEVAGAAALAAEEALAAGDVDTACNCAQTASEIAAGPFLAGEGADWAERVRERLRTYRLRVLETLALARSRQGNASAAIEAAALALSLDPFRESAHRCMMAVHAEAGDRAAGLRAYESCRRILAAELGVRPSPETDAAYRELLQDEALDRRGPERRDTAAVPLPDVLRSAGAAPLVGRHRELEQVMDAWSLACQGRPQLLMIAGEAGMGKTSLAGRAARRLHREGATVVYGRCDKELLVPYQPFVEGFGRYIRSCPPDRLRAEVGPGGPDLGRLLVDLPRWLPEFSLPQPAEPETERHRLFGAVAAFVDGMTRSAPVVLVLDDFQWAGTGARVLLRHIRRSVEAGPLLIMVCYRDDELEPETTSADLPGDLAGQRGTHTMQLRGLDDDAVTEYIGAVDALDGNRPAIGREIRLHTGGNPLFVTEVLRHLADGPGSHGGNVSPAMAMSRLGVPPTLQEVLRERCARVSHEARDALEIAAVIGRDFGLELIGSASSHPEGRLIRLLDETSRARLTIEVGNEPGHYSFVHELARDAVYASMSTSRRAYLHRRVAVALEGANRGAAEAAALARHFESGGDIGRAVSYGIVAGDHALACLAYEVAAEHYERALELGLDQPSQQQRRCGVLMTLATAHRKSGNVAEAREAYLQATHLARRLSDPEALAGCALGLGAGGRGVSAWIADEVRISLLEEALAALGHEDSDLRVRLLAELATALYFSSEDRRRHALADEAVEVARRLGRPTVLAGALSATRMIRWGPANTELRLAYADDVLALSKETEDDELIVRARLERIPDLIELGERGAAGSEVTAALDLATQVRQPYYLWRAISWDALLASFDGRLDDAERRRADALHVWHGEVHTDAIRCNTLQVAVLDAMRGRAADGVEPLRSLADDHPMIPSYRCLLALCLTWAGRHRDAQSELDFFAADGFVSPPVDSNWLAGIAALAETCAVMDDRPRAAVLYDLLTPFADRMVVLEAFGAGGVFLGPVPYQLGLLAATMGRIDHARDHFGAALDASMRVGAARYASGARRALAQLAGSAPVGSSVACVPAGCSNSSN